VFSDIELPRPADDTPSEEPSKKKKKKESKGRTNETNNNIKLTVEQYGGDGLSGDMHRVVGGEPNYQGRWAKGLDYTDEEKIKKAENEIAATQYVRIFHSSGNYSNHGPFSMTQRLS
jgi:hypothetical protein